MDSEKLKMMIEIVETANDDKPVPALRNDSRDGVQSLTSCNIEVIKRKADGKLILSVS